MNRDSETLIKVIRRMPPPQPRPGFVDRVLANETRGAHAAAAARPSQLSELMERWEPWLGTLWAATAAVLVLLLLRSLASGTDEQGITLTLNEVRDIDVLVQSKRDLERATIHITVTGGVALNGLENEHEIDWQASLQRGSNLISLPVVARHAGEGQLVAVIAHGGKMRRMTVNLTVTQAGIS